jgi:hypothetical protein
MQCKRTHDVCSTGNELVEDGLSSMVVARGPTDGMPLGLELHYGGNDWCPCSDCGDIW